MKDEKTENALPLDEGQGASIAIDIEDLALEEFEVPDIEDSEVTDTSGGSTLTAFIGSGQGGSRLAKAFYDIGYTKAIVLNTTRKDLDPVEFPEKQKYLMQIEKEGGAGKDMAVGARAAELHESNIKRLMESIIGPKVDQIEICIGAGGGTGAGSVMRLIQMAKEYVEYHVRDEQGNTVLPGERVGVILALPTRGEAMSATVRANAKAVTEELFALAKNKNISHLIIMDNDRIDRMMGKFVTGKTYWPSINKQIAGLFHVFNQVSNQASEYTSFDPADYQSIIRAGGCCIMGTNLVKDFGDREKVISAIKNNLEKTLLATGFDLKTAKMAGVIAVAGGTILSETIGLMGTINEGFDMFSELLGKEANLHRGIYEGTKDKLVVYTIVSGLDICHQRIAQLG